MSGDADDEFSPATHFAYKPTLVGAPLEFVLRDDRIECRRAGRTFAFVPYRDVRKVRLAFRPLTMQSYRFIAEIWSRGGPKLSLASSSPRGIVGHEQHDEHYKVFVTELHRRIAAAGGDVEYLSGSPSFLYWPGVVVFFGLCAGVLLLVKQAMESDSKVAFLVVGAMLLFFLYQTGMFFYRNRPGRYTPDTLPKDVMP